MNKRKLTKLELQERQITEDKKFNKILLISFSILILLTVSVFVFYTYWCDTKYTYRQYALYGKEIPPELICMNGDNLKIHESSEESYQGKIYYFCSKDCYNHFVNHFRQDAFVPDSFSGDTICKADALIGLKNRGKPWVVYFKNKKTFNQYYEARR
jgi:ribosomal protein L24E